MTSKRFALAFKSDNNAAKVEVAAAHMGWRFPDRSSGQMVQQPHGAPVRCVR